MRIAQVSTQRGWGGGEQQASLLALGLARRGHESLVLARADGQFGRRMADAGLTVAPIAGGGRSPLALWQIRRQLARWRVDVVHFHDPHALSGAGLACCGLAIPVRIAARKVAFPIRSGWRYHRLADRVICVSRSVERCCLASGIAPDRLRVVYDGVDPATISVGDRQRGRLALGAAEDDAILLAVGSLTETKGHRYLIEALPAIRSVCPRARLAIAGEGPERAALEHQIGELGLTGCVTLLGHRSDVPDLIHACDLFVLPSRMEGLCSTLVDVMLAGRPIVASRVGGVPELLEAEQPGRAALGWLVPPGDPKVLADGVIAALGRRNQLDEQLAQARQHALDHFTAERMIDETLAVYQEVLAARQAA